MDHSAGHIDWSCLQHLGLETYFRLERTFVTILHGGQQFDDFRVYPTDHVHVPAADCTIPSTLPPRKRKKRVPVLLPRRVFMIEHLFTTWAHRRQIDAQHTIKCDANNNKATGHGARLLGPKCKELQRRVWSRVDGTGSTMGCKRNEAWLVCFYKLKNEPSPAKQRKVGVAAVWNPTRAVDHVARGVMRIDGARGNKQVLAPPCSNLRSFGSKCTVLKKVLVTFLGLLAHPAVIRRPRNVPPLITTLYITYCSTLRRDDDSD